MTTLTTHDRDQARVQRVLSLLAGRSSPVGTVLDLACRTGVFMSALHDKGIAVTGVEGRIENVQQIAPHLRPSVIHSDVRDLRARLTGPFDATLCLGILYHLDAEDAVHLLQDIAVITNGALIIDTHVSTTTAEMTTVDGRVYYGSRYFEGDASDFRWAALGNQNSWWFTEESLMTALAEAGFSGARVIPGAAYADELPSRRWFITESGLTQ